MESAITFVFYARKSVMLEICCVVAVFVSTEAKMALFARNSEDFGIVTRHFRGFDKENFGKMVFDKTITTDFNIMGLRFLEPFQKRLNYLQSPIYQIRRQTVQQTLRQGYRVLKGTGLLLKRSFN